MTVADTAADDAAALLRRFQADFNAGHSDRMAGYYTTDFAAIVNGAAVDRAAYLQSVDQLLSAGFGEIRFETHLYRRLAPELVLVHGTTFIADPGGATHRSAFSIICAGGGPAMRFAQTHSSVPGVAP
ncbi:Cif family virulence factor [Sphingobium chungbukense]|uniref:hypothetical protein n=1 Tax=Sphingobium chungbukense TaxID=56193 RepID=UPI000629031F|nr:hypothetical protein [Sphingobium chungbukense]